MFEIKILGNGKAECEGLNASYHCGWWSSGAEGGKLILKKEN